MSDHLAKQAAAVAASAAAIDWTAPDGTKFIGITTRPDGSKHIKRIEFANGISTFHDAVEHPDGTQTVGRIEYHRVGGEQRGVAFSDDAIAVQECLLPDGEIVRNPVQ